MLAKDCLPMTMHCQPSQRPSTRPNHFARNSYGGECGEDSPHPAQSEMYEKNRDYLDEKVTDSERFWGVKPGRLACGRGIGQ